MVIEERIDTSERIAKLETQVEAIKEDVSELRADIKELHSRITTGNREIVDKLQMLQVQIENKMNEAAVVSKNQHDAIETHVKGEILRATERIQILERWRYTLIGGALVVGYLISQLDVLSKIFK